MKRYCNALIITACIFTLMFCFSCSKKQVKDDATAGGTGTGTGIESTTKQGVLEESVLGAEDFQEIPESQAALKGIFKDIYFDYDDFSLTPDAKTVLDDIAEWLLQNTAAYVLIEGHCDDRGTSEYNLALGERRANSAKKYLAHLGVAQKRISTLSYGEEKPLDPEQNEAAWTKNRRGHFLIR